MNTTNEVNAPQEIKTTQEGAHVDLNTVEAPDYARQADPEGLDALGLDMEQNTQLQNVVLIPKADGGYECVIGNRRVAAAKKRGWKTIRADIKEGLSETQKLMMTLAENNERENESPFYTASLFQRIKDAEGLEPVKLAAKLGKDLGLITKYLAFMDLPQEVRTNLNAFKLSFRQALAIAKLTKVEDQLKVMEECAKDGLAGKALEKRIRQLLKPVPAGTEAPKPPMPEGPFQFIWKGNGLVIKGRPFTPHTESLMQYQNEMSDAYDKFMEEEKTHAQAA